MKSQSLSSRAMSFDSYGVIKMIKFELVSIPFEQGDVFRHTALYNILENFIYITIKKEKNAIHFAPVDLCRPS